MINHAPAKSQPTLALAFDSGGVALFTHPSANGKPSVFHTEYPGSNPRGCSIFTTWQTMVLFLKPSSHRK